MSTALLDLLQSVNQVDAFDYAQTLRTQMNELDQRMDSLAESIESYTQPIDELIRSIRGYFVDPIDDYELILGSRLYNTARSRASRHPGNHELQDVKDTFKHVRALRRQQYKQQQQLQQLRNQQHKEMKIAMSQSRAERIKQQINLINRYTELTNELTPNHLKMLQIVDSW